MGVPFGVPMGEGGMTMIGGMLYTGAVAEGEISDRMLAKKRGEESKKMMEACCTLGKGKWKGGKRKGKLRKRKRSREIPV